MNSPAKNAPAAGTPFAGDHGPVLRILIADDHPLFLDGLALLLETTPGMDVVGRAANGHELLELAAHVAFDVAVVDLDMPGLDGASAIAELLRRSPEAVAITLTMHDGAASVRRAVRAGARGYVVKGAGQGALVRAIIAAAEGDFVFSGAAAAHVVEALQSGGGAGYSGFSARESELLALVGTGAGNPAIGGELGVSTKTVQNNVSLLMTKLGVNSRALPVAAARDMANPQGG